MQSAINAEDTKKSITLLSKNEEHIPNHPLIMIGKKTDHQEITATATDYLAEKRSDSKDDEIDALRDWFQAEMEMSNELDLFDVDERDFQFFTPRLSDKSEKYDPICRYSKDQLVAYCVICLKTPASSFLLPTDRQHRNSASLKQFLLSSE